MKIKELLMLLFALLLLGCATTKDAFNQAKAFSETTNVGSIIVTKLDGSAKGGGGASSICGSSG